MSVLPRRRRRARWPVSRCQRSFASCRDLDFNVSGLNSSPNIACMKSFALNNACPATVTCKTLHFNRMRASRRSFMRQGRIDGISFEHLHKMSKPGMPWGPRVRSAAKPVAHAGSVCSSMLTLNHERHCRRRGRLSRCTATVPSIRMSSPASS